MKIRESHKYKFKVTLYILWLMSLAWIGTTSLIQRIKTPHLTNTQLFMRLHKTIFLDFNE